MTNQPLWLDWAQRLQAIAQSGLTYTTNVFDIERFEDLRQIAAEILAAHTDHDLPYISDLLAGEQGYATPKLDVRGVVFRDDKILLVKERVDGGWTLPGGWIDVGEPPSLAAEREVWEESGYRVRATRLLALFDRNRHGHPAYIFHIYKLFIACDLLGGEPSTSIETDGAEFFAEDALPPLSVPRTSADELTAMFRHHRQPGLPTDFD
ncbi:MAG TPA: NUDIX hydrolase [Anaerolineaceae bacterium]|nr:NUDIX hydrolase [Anaerolineaceae bacterium]HQH86762.1 NUDIX hydrolase [Anaerolineaceae bacterium]